jgi:release factor glutamine methyltransferase
MTAIVAEIIEMGQRKLAAAGVYSPEKDAETIIAHALGLAFGDLSRHKEDTIDESQLTKITRMLGRRAAREPLARLLGSVEFTGINVKLAAGVFEPQAESAALAEHAALLFEGHQGPLRVLDIGTGSGALLLATLKALPQATGVGVDQSATAIDLAKENAQENELAGRAAFQVTDLASGLPERFDLILSNLPFVPSARLEHLMPEMRDHNPRTALDGGADGLDLYRRLLPMLEAVAHDKTIWLVQTSLDALQPMQYFFAAAGFRQVERLNNHYGVPACLKIGMQRQVSFFSRFFARFAH